MMEEADRTEHGDSSPDPSQGAVAPIVIVQRGRSSWGRESLLLLLLLATMGYIVYQEYRSPWFIERGEPRVDARLVDARPVTPVAEGAIVLRAEGASGHLDDPFEPNLPAPDDPADRPIESEPPSLPDATDATGHEPGVSPSSMAGAELGADAPEVEAIAIPDVLPDPDEDVVRPDGPPARENRASIEIVLDPDRLNGPPVAPPLPRANRPAPIRDRDIARRPVDPEAPILRGAEPQTPEQRRHFLKCLAIAIQQYGLGAGPHIEGLCQASPSDLPREVRLLEQRFGPEALVAGTDLDWTITRLRRMGAPEPYLLDRISDLMYRTIGVRHGPHDRMEARVFAARKLLEIPLEVPVAARQ